MHDGFCLIKRHANADRWGAWNASTCAEAKLPSLKQNRVASEFVGTGHPLWSSGFRKADGDWQCHLWPGDPLDRKARFSRGRTCRNGRLEPLISARCSAAPRRLDRGPSTCCSSSGVIGDQDDGQGGARSIRCRPAMASSRNFPSMASIHPEVHAHALVRSVMGSNGLSSAGSPCQNASVPDINAAVMGL